MPENDPTSGRDRITQALRAELLGPAPSGKPLDKSSFATKEESYGPWVNADTGEEILERAPLVRYGVGVLYPVAGATSPGIADQTIVPGLTAEDTDGPQTAEWAGSTGRLGAASDDADFDLSGANERKPTAMGISFLLALQPDTGLRIEVTGGRYEQFKVDLPGGARRTWWTRIPVTAVWLLKPEQLHQLPALYRDLTPDANQCTGLEGLDLRLTVNLRHHPAGALTTVALVNRSVPGSKQLDAVSLFQAGMTATPDNGWISPYPESPAAGAHPDDASFQLIYRHEQTYAIGHGCAADWATPDGAGRSLWAKADPLPEYEAPSITPDVVLNGKPLTVSMAQLAGTEPGGMAQLERVVEAYAEWIGARKAEIPGLDEKYRATAERHMEDCTRALDRMCEGLGLIRDPQSLIGRAFRLANAAMLKQQLRSGAKLRTTERVDERNNVAGEPPDEQAAARNGRGRWRAFQIAFLLAAIPSTADTGHMDRLAVDLIFFPTGGGKTEAYLGLSAFAMLLRRLRNPEDAGVTVLMRYTLRLLTAQQFLRAAGLICALEDLRRKEEDLGSERFSIGIWVGGDSTPNRNADAIKALNNLGSEGGENPFLLLRCPWCAAQMGPVKSTSSPDAAAAGRGRGARRQPRRQSNAVAGYESYRGRVLFLCPDSSCDFSSVRNPLPVYVVDDDVYDNRPSLVIGTVDKFALLAWNPRARALFGIEESGQRTDCSPPELIIQDELHLIAGPLGSMTGLYEGVIEDLCTDRRNGFPSPPKIIASTATIRRHEEQVRALYARETVHLFPPHGLEAGDSFFSVYARDLATGERLPGRRYIGVHAPSLGSMQTTQVRSFAALLQAAKDAPEHQQDPWWTLMAFFNSLRELGNSLSLMQSDIPDYLKTINNRAAADRTAVRYLNRVEEMTSRLRQDQIPEAMEKLAQKAQDGKAIDVCLASSLIEVGIDIDRLSLMTVIGQPKSTSQYIQVTGRVGRRWDERPGLVVTLYGAAKPRDRSHFERFRSYHQRLYAQVEPTSATPFAPPALERALHAVVVAYIRQKSDPSRSPFPFPGELFEEAEELLLARAAVCDPGELPRLEGVLAKLRKEWTNWQPTAWGTPGGSPELGDLMRAAGQYADGDIALSTWPTPTSMRGADAECRTKITMEYALEGGRQ